MPRSRSRSRDRSDRRRSRSRERRRRHRRRRSSSSSSDIASDVYSKMLSKQKRTEKNYGDTDLRKKEREEMEKLRQIRQQEQNEIYIKQQVDKRVALEVGLKVEEEIARRMPEIEKKIAAKIRSEEAATPPADTSDNKLNREQVELINELKHREVKHVDHIHKLEKFCYDNPPNQS
ncbi:Oidioi.mRNA.OKI2018_I69.chr2.g7915.t1.cds [Oikopleura dioica]|uniref:Oidioi.mRNA.OKI2018_I69.chr2.g7915.t1.cds n=1 Tax=Oikopleura dioica TaxID=34765 RepID=A0ABN7TE45_OIKDI|nr:Oidioi.mRNA.OKI2018_I69.chr2.g7915.t1.cds [Oikopleura dioica]